MCRKIIIALIICFVQVLAMPGMIGGGGFIGGGMMGGVPGLETTLSAVKAIATFNKQLGLQQATLKKAITTSKNEIKAQLDLLKLQVSAIPPENPCSTSASTSISGIEIELLTAFTQCQKKDELKELRFQSLNLKQQMATLKLAKKACLLEVDPAACLNDATEGANDGIGQISEDVNNGLTAIIVEANECIQDVSEDLLARIEDVKDDLLVC